MYSNKTIKELKQLLEEHNCAVPNGAKKKDLVELVEAIMSKDEDFVTMQVENPDDMFDELFDNTIEEEVKEAGMEYVGGFKIGKETFTFRPLRVYQAISIGS